MHKVVTVSVALRMIICIIGLTPVTVCSTSQRNDPLAGITSLFYFSFTVSLIVTYYLCVGLCVIH